MCLNFYLAVWGSGHNQRWTLLCQWTVWPVDFPCDPTNKKRLCSFESRGGVSLSNRLGWRAAAPPPPKPPDPSQMWGAFENEWKVEVTGAQAAAGATSTWLRKREYPMAVFNQRQWDGMGFIALWWRAQLWRWTVTLLSKWNHRLAYNSQRKGPFVSHRGVRQGRRCCVEAACMHFPHSERAQSYIWWEETDRSQRDTLYILYVLQQQ